MRGESYKVRYNLCRDASPEDPYKLGKGSFNNCFDAAWAGSKDAYPNKTLFGTMAMLSIIPLALGWFLSYISVRIFRWVRAGFTGAGQ